MTALTRFRLNRIRKAAAEDIERMAGQEGYFNVRAFREILSRIETLNTQDPAEAYRACEYIYRLSSEIRSVPPDLRAFALAVHGSAARACGHLDTAIEKYHQALVIPRLTPAGRADVLARLSVTHMAADQAELALKRIEEAIPLVADPLPALAVRGWIKMVIRPLSEALDDCVEVMAACRKAGRFDYTRFSAIVNACNILSYTTCHAEPAVIEQVKNEVQEYRRSLPKGGSNFLKVRRERLNLTRANALLMLKTGQEGMAAYGLKRSAEGLRRDYPDDALDAYTDLICTLAKLGRESEAAQKAGEAADLLEHVTYMLEPMGRNALIAASQRAKLSYPEALEIKTLLRLRKNRSALG